MKELAAVLAAFTEATQCGAVVWTQPSGGGPLTAEVGAPAGDPPVIVELIPVGGAAVEVHTTNGSINLWIDDMATPVFSVTGVSTAKTDSTSKEVVVGLYAQDSTGTMRARYDDVVIDY